MAIYLDTHVAVWLYAGEIGRFGAAARRRLDEEELVVSPIVLLELQYLRETKRITAEPAQVLRSLESSLGLGVCDLSFAEVVNESLRAGWTRDPFDRLIVAHAAVRDAPLLTKDRQMRRHYPKAFW